MQELLKAGDRAATIEEIIEKRLEVLASGDEEEIDKFVNNYLDSSTGIVTYKRETEDGIKDKIKIIPNCETLKNIGRNPELYNGGIELTEEEYNQLEGEVFNREDLILNESLTEEEAKEHPIWKELVGEEALNDYVDAVFDFVKEEYGEDKAMGVWIHDGKDVPVLRSCGVDRVGGYGGSGHDGGNSLGYNARLVGVKDAEGVAENFEGVLSEYKINSEEELRKALDMYKHAKSVLEQ